MLPFLYFLDKPPNYRWQAATTQLYFFVSYVNHQGNNGKQQQEVLGCRLFFLQNCKTSLSRDIKAIRGRKYIFISFFTDAGLTNAGAAHDAIEQEAAQQSHVAHSCLITFSSHLHSPPAVCLWLEVTSSQPLSQRCSQWCLGPVRAC